MEYQIKRALWKITEYRDGCVYKAEFVRDVWVDGKNRPLPPEGHLYATPEKYENPRIVEGELT
jgi:hypothetical protein